MHQVYRCKLFLEIERMMDQKRRRDKKWKNEDEIIRSANYGIMALFQHLQIWRLIRFVYVCTLLVARARTTGVGISEVMKIKSVSSSTSCFQRWRRIACKLRTTAFSR